MPIKLGRKKYFLINDLVEILPINALTIREYLREGKIKGQKLGKLWTVEKADLERFLEGDNYNVWESKY